MGNAPAIEAQLRDVIIDDADIYILGVQEGNYRAPAGYASNVEHWYALAEKVRY